MANRSNAKRVQNGDILELEGAQIIYPNFNGDPDPYNSQGGRRYFTVRIDDPAEAQRLRDEGWYVVPKVSREDPDEILFWKLKVNVKYHPGNRRFDPRIWQVTDGHEVELPEDLVGELDRAEIEYADLEIRAYDYSARNSSGSGTGISAYLKQGWFVIRESRFAAKHRSMTDPIDDEPPF